MTRTLIDEIKSVINDEANNNPAPLLCEIVKSYPNANFADVRAEEYGLFERLQVIGDNSVGLKGIICFADGNQDNAIVITSTKTIIDNTVTETSANPVKSSGIYSAIHNNNFEQVYTHSSWNSTYFDTGWCQFYKMNNLVLVRYNITSKNLGASGADKIITDNAIDESVIPAYRSVNIVNTASPGTNINLTINTEGKIILYPYDSNQTVNIAGTVMYIANTEEET